MLKKLVGGFMPKPEDLANLKTKKFYPFNFVASNIVITFAYYN